MSVSPPKLKQRNQTANSKPSVTEVLKNIPRVVFFIKKKNTTKKYFARVTLCQLISCENKSCYYCEVTVKGRL